jgi:hypothetical protein
MEPINEEVPVSEVKFMRLDNGEDIISEIVRYDDTILLLHPLKLLYTSSAKPGYLSISLMQWVFTKITEDQTFEMPKSAVLLYSEPTDALKEYYWSTVNHFISKTTEHGKRIGFEAEPSEIGDEEEYNTTESDEALEMLEKLLGGFTKPDKSKLH